MLEKRICEYCNREFFEKSCRIKEGRGRFCCRSCYDLSRKTNEYVFEQDYVIIRVKNSKGEIFEGYIDAEDYEKVKDYTWGVEGKKNRATYYFCSRTFKERVAMHRLIMDCTNSKLQIDHINHNGLDNRKSNLRMVTNKKNQENRKINKNNKTGYNGVLFYRNRWIVSITHNYKNIHLGRFKTKEEAIQARKEAEKELGWIQH